MNNLTGTIINDCADDLARARQEIRFAALFGVRPTFLGVGSYSPIEAAGSLLDVLDVLVNFPSANDSQQHVVLVNVAPRGEDIQQKWDNGTPFCYFRVGNVLVVCAYEGQCLALARDVGIVGEVALLDVPTVTAAAVGWGELSVEQAQKINNTQFRSLEFLPLVAFWLCQGRPVPSTKQSLVALPSAKAQVWHVDNFDNAKTTLLPKDVGFEQGREVVLADGRRATCFERLADVPQGATAFTIGSSGYGPHRFLEVAIGHRGRAATRHGLRAGSPVIVHNTVKQVD